jgi:hypothetical protein
MPGSADELGMSSAGVDEVEPTEDFSWAYDVDGGNSSVGVSLTNTICLRVNVLQGNFHDLSPQIRNTPTSFSLRDTTPFLSIDAGTQSDSFSTRLLPTSCTNSTQPSSRKRPRSDYDGFESD